MALKMRDYVFALTAGQELERGVPGNWFHVIEATGDITIRFDDGDTLVRPEGMGGSANYEKVTLLSATTQTVKIALGYGQVTDSRATVNATINTTDAPANINDPLGEVSVGAGATVLLAGADATRKALRVGVRANQPGGIYIGSLSAGAVTPGGYIEEGSVDYVATEGALYAYNDGASAVVVNLLSLERV